MRENPYKYTGPLDPVADRTVFIPRSEDIGRFIEGLNKGEYWVVVGPAHVGKTTFLRHVAYENNHAYNISLDLTESLRDLETFYKWLIKQLIERVPQDLIAKLKAKEQYLNLESPISTLDLLHFLKNFPAADRQIVLFLDDVENMPFLKEFLHIWRTIQAQKLEVTAFCKYSIIMTGSLKLVEQTVGFGSPLANIAKTLYLSDFSYPQSRQLIDEPFKHSGISIDDKAKEKLIDSLKGHPRMLQQSCHFLVQRAFEKNEHLTEKDVDDALAYVREENPVLITLAQDIKTRNRLSNLIKRLLKGEHVEYSSFEELSYAAAGAIVEGPDSYCVIRNRLFEEFLKDTLEKKKPVTFPVDAMIKKKSEDVYLDNNRKSPMPFAIKQIQVRNYHGIIDTGINLPIDARWIFLTGENAFGKTALLRAITIGLHGPTDQGTILLNPEKERSNKFSLQGQKNQKKSLTDSEKECENEYDSKIGVEIYYKNDSLIHNVGCPGVKPSSFGYFAAYGSSRLEIQSNRTANEITGRSARTYSIFNTDGVSLNIERELVFWFLKKDPRYETVKSILLSLLPHGADITVDAENNEILYTEKENEEDGGGFFEPIPFQKLAAGNKGIISMVGDLLIRFYKEYESDGLRDIDPVDFEGIVLIDELDLHLHPKWMRRLPKLLSDIFPKIQFIAATHSEIPILGAPKDSIFLKVTRTEEKGIQVERVDLDIKNLLPHHLLTSPIFGLDKEIYPASNERLADMKTSENYYKALEFEESQIMDDLRKFEESDRDFPDDLFEPV